LGFALGQKERDWSEVWFADETRFTLYPRPNRKNDVVWTAAAGAADAVPPVPRVAHPAGINAYAAFSASGKTDIALFPGIMTAEVYVGLLQGTLLPAVRAAVGEQRWTYLHDGDPKHRARQTQEWLKAHAPEYFTPDQWPPRSPDLNPMEHAWAAVKARVALSEPKTVGALKKLIRAAWKAVMTEEFRRSLSASMPRRLAAVRRARGGPTKY
jgi:hypothetical protein